MAEALRKGEMQGECTTEKGVLPLGTEKASSDRRSLERVSRELMFGAGVQVLGWI